MRRRNFVPTSLRCDIVQRVLELAPSTLGAGWVATEQVADVLGCGKRELRPILKELRRMRRINGYHVGPVEMWRAKNVMFG